MIGIRQYKPTHDSPITAVVFVSREDATTIDNATLDDAKTLMQQGIRLVLVGLEGLNMGAFRPLVRNDRDLDSTWDARNQTTPHDYQLWFANLLNCEQAGLKNIFLRNF